LAQRRIMLYWVRRGADHAERVVQVVWPRRVRQNEGRDGSEHGGHRRGSASFRASGLGGWAKTKAETAPSTLVTVAPARRMSAIQFEALKRSRMVAVAPAMSVAPSCMKRPF